MALTTGASLQVDYSSLVDVRIIKHGNLSAAKSVTAGVSQVASGDQGGASCSRQKSYKEPKGKEPAAPRQGIVYIFAKNQVSNGVSKVVEYDLTFIE